MNKLMVKLRTVTPLFLTGAEIAEINGEAETRVSSFKGAMRFWYRAIDGDYRQNENGIFGGTGKSEGQAAFLMQIKDLITGKETWHRKKYDLLTDKGSRQNGINYLGYSLDLGDRKRKFIPVGKDIEVSLAFKKEINDKEKINVALRHKAVLAAWWLLSHVGGLGSRSRRGFGTLAFQEWLVVEGEKWAELEELPFAHGAKTPEEWLKIFQTGLETLKKWFPKEIKKDHTVLAAGSRFFLFKEGFPKGRIKNQDIEFEGWELALNEAGKILQAFRNRWKLDDHSTDYHIVKAHLAKVYGRSIVDPRPALLARCPERVAFGLPLTFRYNSLKEQVGVKKDGKPKYEVPEVAFEGEIHNRSASPLFVRIVQINDKYHPFFALLKAPLLSSGEKIKARAKTKKENECFLEPADSNILTRFCDQELKPKSLPEVIL
ncbi:MAG: type III-B CRISPR module RAMP protein Cmr1 [Peptococcaceae bacterium]|nr:MAG: type III-B CRISPR module RAMP protein Cmr1 [Peptococcaceae bacterium]